TTFRCSCWAKPASRDARPCRHAPSDESPFSMQEGTSLMPSRLLRSAVAAVLLAAAVPAAAQAASLSLSTSPDPAEDRPVTIYANAVSGTESELIVVVRNAGGASCGATYL